MKNVLAIIMAGGEGTRLSVLAKRRAKPAVPFGGDYRVIDFTMSNIMHSGGRHVGVITQYRPYSLADHLGQGEWWGMAGFGSKLRVLAPHTGDRDSSFYLNTADAIYRNIEFIERFPQATEILILSGDHIYQMDYREILAFHRENRARLTLATQRVPWEETSRFGIMVCDDRGSINEFQEKPKQNPRSNLASLGIYVFDRACLLDALNEDHADPESAHDFGGDIIPKLIEGGDVFNFEFRGYWRDIGTIPSYVETSMDLLDPESGLDLARWDVRTNHQQIELRHQRPMQLSGKGSVRDSYVSKGGAIGGEVERSILSPGVRIHPGAHVRRSILLHNVTVGEGAVVEDAIIDKHSIIGRGARVGAASLGSDANEKYPHLLSCGTTLIGKGACVPAGVTLGRNCIIHPNVQVDAKPGTCLAAGSTF